MTGSSSLWAPLSLGEATSLFASAPFRWWVTGGHALELHLGESWRAHDDIDLSFCRGDAHEIRTLLAEWDVHVAAAGNLSPWSGGALSAAARENNLWCRRTRTDPWSLDLTLSEGDADAWIFRRDPSLRVPWVRAVLRTADGIPYLAPELQLLFKQRDPRTKDDVDAVKVIPRLDAERRSALDAHLPAGHPWRALT